MTKKEEPATLKSDTVYTVGSYLKMKREEMKLTIDDVAENTRISKNYIIAIENDNFDVIPAEVYCRGFLKLYASYLKLNPDEVIALYLKTHGDRLEQSKDNLVYKYKIEEEKKNFGLTEYLIFALITIGILAGILYFILK